jgi:hypothetical protein
MTFRRLILLFTGWVLICSAYAEISGPIRVSENGRYFVDGNGDPFYWLGDTQWELFVDFDLEEVEAVCEDRRVKGFSALQIMLLGLDAVTRTNINGDSPFINDDPETPNEAFFLLVDSIVEIADQKELVLVIGIYHKRDQWSNYITVSNARTYASWLGQRYQNDLNVIWSMYPEANDSYIPIVREMAEGLLEGSGGAHMITVHPDPAPGSSSWIHNESWLSFNTFQTWSSGFINYEMTENDYNLEPVKPVVNGEARYEEEGGTTPLQARNGAYWSCLAGGFYSFGHGGNWMSPTDWESWIDSPGSQQMKVLGDLFRSLEWWKLVPDQSVISSGADQKATARSSDGDWILAYLPNGGSIEILMDNITAADTVEASWIDPVTGDMTAIGEFLNSGTQNFTAPGGWSDAVLLLEAKSPAVGVLPWHENISIPNIVASPAHVAMYNCRGQMISALNVLKSRNAIIYKPVIILP